VSFDFRDALVHILRKVQIAGAEEKPLVEIEAIQTVHDAVGVIDDPKSAGHGFTYAGQNAVESVVKTDSEAQHHQSQAETKPDCFRVFPRIDVHRFSHPFGGDNANRLIDRA